MTRQYIIRSKEEKLVIVKQALPKNVNSIQDGIDGIDNFVSKRIAYFKKKLLRFFFL